MLPDLELAKLLVEGSQTEAVQLPASFSPGREEVVVLLVDLAAPIAIAPTCRCRSDLVAVSFLDLSLREPRAGGRDSSDMFRMEQNFRVVPSVIPKSSPNYLVSLKTTSIF